jgi:hypothetical protein
MKQRATVFLRRGRLFIHSTSITTSGVGIATEPFIALSIDNDPEAIGMAVMEALNASHEKFPHPTNWKGILDPLLKAASCKTWHTFANKAECCELLRENDFLTIIPTHRRSEDDSFEHLASESVMLKHLSDDELGKCLLAHFRPDQKGA